MDDGADAVAVVVLDAELLHQLAVAGGDGVSIDLGVDAVAADLFNIGHAAAVDLLAVGLLQALADGMRGGAFRQRGVFQKLLLVERAVVNGGDLKDALRQRTGLVEDDDLRLGQRFEIVGALDQDALLAGAADARRRSSAGC